MLMTTAEESLWRDVSSTGTLAKPVWVLLPFMPD